MFNGFTGEPTVDDEAPTEYMSLPDPAKTKAATKASSHSGRKKKPAAGFIQEPLPLWFERVRIDRSRLKPPPPWLEPPQPPTPSEPTLPIFDPKHTMWPLVEQVVRALGYVNLALLIICTPFLLLCLWYGVGLDLGNHVLLAAFVLYLFFPVADLLFLPMLTRYVTEKWMQWHEAPWWIIWAPILIFQFVVLNYLIWTARLWSPS